MFKNVSYKTQRKFIIALFLLIPLTLLFVFTYLPAINMISYSFTNWKGYGPKTFVGLENYINIFSDPEVFSVLKNMFIKKLDNDFPFFFCTFAPENHNN